MPAYYTHKYFANNIFSLINNQNIDLNYFLLFSQSFDILYYNLGISKNAKEIKRLGKTAHYKNTQAFFINAINIALKENLQNDSHVRSFILGFLTHYILDSTFHPYIFYKTGIFKHNKDTIKYKGKHTYLELMLDYYFFKKEHQIKFHKFKHYKAYDNISIPSSTFLDYINKVFKKTYNKNDIAYYYFKDIKNWRFITKYFKNLNAHFLKIVYRIHDKLFRYKNSLVNYSYYIKELDQNILNNNNLIWYNPADKSIQYYNNVEDLYKEALDKYISISNHILNVLDKKEDIHSLTDIIPNISYFNGLDLSLNKRARYFEY